MDVEALADRIWDAIENRRSIHPLTDDVPDLTVDGAYAVQEAVLARHRASGASITVAKLGLTSTAKQRQMKVDEPLYGWMTDRMELAESERLDAGRFIQPRAEPEVAVRTSRSLAGSAVTGAEVVASIDAVAPALDILDSRFTGYSFTLADVTADNSSAAACRIGPWIRPSADLRLTGCVFEKNGELVATAAGASVMEHPAEAVAWFVRKLHSQNKVLPAGSVVLAGAWTAAVPVAPGDVVRATFDRIGSVEIEVI